MLICYLSISDGERISRHKKILVDSMRLCMELFLADDRQSVSRCNVYLLSKRIQH